MTSGLLATGITTWFSIQAFVNLGAVIGILPITGVPLPFISFGSSAMLPGATVLDVRRDPLETAWSCFRQQFMAQPHFACSFEDIATYLHGCERAMDACRERDPGRFHLLRYETLLAHPHATIRARLGTWGLAFDRGCLDFHRARRSVRTASAAQVRQPLRRDTAPAAGYGALLDPLRAALARE